MAHAVTLEDARTAELRIQMSYEDYLAFIDESTHSEWVDGEAIIFMPPTWRHQQISTFLVMVLGTFLTVKRLGQIVHAPFEMKLRAGRSYREPDILVLLTEHLGRQTGKRLEGPADVVFELVSPDSTARDRREKFAEFQEAGIPEYWLIDTREDRFSLDAFCLDDTGAYQPIPPDAQGRIWSITIPGLWIDPAWLSGDDLADITEVYRALLPSLFGA